MQRVVELHHTALLPASCGLSIYPQPELHWSLTTGRAFTRCPICIEKGDGTMMIPVHWWNIAVLPCFHGSRKVPAMWCGLPGESGAYIPWSCWRGSNPRPAAYKTAALPLSYNSMVSTRLFSLVFHTIIIVLYGVPFHAILPSQKHLPFFTMEQVEQVERTFYKTPK